MNPLVRDAIAHQRGIKYLWVYRYFEGKAEKYFIRLSFRTSEARARRNLN